MTASHIPAFNPNYLDEGTITKALADGTHAPVLQAYFGAPAYAELTLLAQQAVQTRCDKQAPCVYVLPGLLGSKLAVSTAKHSEVLWLDPSSVMAGKLVQLAIGKRRSIRATGVMLAAYLKLGLTLQAAGMPVKLFPYDWRRSIIELGKRLAEELRHEPAKEVMLVAHSMGGLVTRVALNHPAAAKVSRVVQLGTPNQGSFALLQALRACYPTVRKLGALDHLYSAEQLTQQVFRSFYSFYEMLPGPAYTPDLNLFDYRQWPQDDFTPRPDRLNLGKRITRHLAKADRRCHAIVGIEQATITGVRRVADEFVFQVTPEGDGTVPVALAKWQQARHWYIREAHGLLPRNTQVCQAVVELLNNETTRILPTEFASSQTDSVEYSEAEMKLLPNCTVRWDRLPLSERRDLLEPVISAAFTAACHSK
ncbi:MAG: lipase family alpha/beta hydrolase [Steroidobacteraceae bacterium]